jgi:hypothetical protein
MTNISSRNSSYCYAVEIAGDPFFGNTHCKLHFISYSPLT